MLNAYAGVMTTIAPHSIAVIFIAQRTTDDEAGYTEAANAMVELAALQHGYMGIDSVRDAAGLGITVSYWADEGAAQSWRDNPDHAAIRDMGRARWYSHYSLHVTAIERSYDWKKS